MGVAAHTTRSSRYLAIRVTFFDDASMGVAAHTTRSSCYLAIRVTEWD